MKNTHGDFGKVSKIYNDVRPRMPEEVIKYILSYTNAHSNMLDVGCGTGLITKQFSTFIDSIMATDNGAEMLEIAQQENQADNISYLLLATENLNLKENSFDFVTAFSSFHWFANDAALNKISFCLKTGGKFFAINRNMKGIFNELQKECNEIFKKFSNPGIQSKKKDYKPEETLTNFGFKNVKKEIFKFSEPETKEGLLNFLKTTSIFSIIPDDKKTLAEDEAMQLISKRIENNFTKEFEIVVVHGEK